MFEINLQKISALVMIAGSLLFLIAAFMPVSRVFAEPSAAKKLEIILQSRNMWTFSQVFFASGAIVTCIGIGLTGVLFHNQPISKIIYISTLFLTTGAIFWTSHVWLRAADPAAFTKGAIPVWLFAAYTILTQAGLLFYGSALLRSPLSDWVGWLMICSMVLFFLLTIIFLDMPPFVYYVITLVTGIMIYRTDVLAII